MTKSLQGDVKHLIFPFTKGTLYQVLARAHLELCRARDAVIKYDMVKVLPDERVKGV